MSDNKPSICVVIPAYRCADSIADVIDALLAQTIAPEKIIVVNDCSPDNLSDVLSGFGNRIVQIKNTKNLGLSKSYNQGLRASREEYILTLHSDCILEADYIEKVYSVIASDPSVGAVTGQYMFHNFGDMGLSDQLFSVLNRLPVESDHCSESVDEIAFIEGKADIFRRAELEKFGYFCEKLSITAEDQDLSAKYRAVGYKLLQHQGARFSVKYNGTQDSLWKVLRKQSSYARGQAYVLLKYGYHAVKLTTNNRNSRAFHRLSQLLCGVLMVSLAAASFLFSWLGLVLCLLLIVRAAYYFKIAQPMRLPLRFVAMPFGLIADLFYSCGIFDGSIRYHTIRKF
jgi:GT2 family glycosyltransferase